MTNYYSTPLAVRLAGSAAATDYASNMTYRPDRYPVGSAARVAYVNVWQDLSIYMRQINS